MRKIVLFSLISCILLIQITIAGFFYNEFVNKKNLTFIENQLKEVHLLENLTDDSRKELINAQDYFQKYVMSNDDKYLKSYFNSINKLTKNLDSINDFKYQNPKLKNIFVAHKKDSAETKKLKVLVDSTRQYSTNSNFRGRDELPKPKKYDLNYNFDKFEVQKKTYSDTIKKKGLFGRLGDAISGKQSVVKDSVVVTVKGGKLLDVPTIKGELDSIVSSINHHYTKEIQKIQVNVTKNKDNSGKFYTVFSNLLIYSNKLMSVYDVAVRDSKADLEKELA